MEYKVNRLNGSVFKVYGDSFKEALQRAAKEGENFFRADLSGKHIIAADFSSTDLMGAVFNNADLVFSDFSRSYASFTSFKGATLTCANFMRASLTFADFSNTLITGANFYKADLACANFRGAKYNDKQLWEEYPVYSDKILVAFFFEDGSEPVIQSGNFTGSLSEYEQTDIDTENQHQKMEKEGSLSYIKTIRKFQSNQTTHNIGNHEL